MTTATDMSEQATPRIPISANGARIPAVAANLLPSEIIDARRMRKVRRMVIFTIIPFLAMLAGWYVLASVQTSLAERDLAQAEDGVQFLQQQQKKFSEVTRARAESADIGEQLKTLFAGDIAWAELVRPLQSVAPEGIVLTDVSALKATSGSAGAQPAGGTVAEPVGLLTVSGRAPSKAVAASYVDALGRVHGLANPLLTSAVNKDGLLQFTVQVDITADAVGGRYTAASDKGSGK